MRTISSVPSGFQCTDSDDIGKSIFVQFCDRIMLYIWHCHGLLNFPPVGLF
jgi:hypothetical protein